MVSSIPGQQSIKIIRNQQEIDDDTCATFVIEGEGHTLGNLLRYVLTGNKNVEFFGYCMQHPSQYKINFRIQSKTIPVENILVQGLNDLCQISKVLENKFNEALSNY